MLFYVVVGAVATDAMTTTTAKNLIEEWERKSDGKIGLFARLSLSFVLEHGLVTNEEIAQFETVEGTVKQLGFRLTGLPLLTNGSDPEILWRFWKPAINVNGNPYYVNCQWYERMRTELTDWLRKVLARLGEEFKGTATPGFEKKIDKSMFLHGMSLPNDFHQAALSHLPSLLANGMSQKVRIETDGGVFEARIGIVSLTSGSTRDVMRILWSDKSPIARYIQGKYPRLFEVIMRKEDKAVIESLGVSVRVECAEEKGTFRIRAFEERPMSVKVNETIGDKKQLKSEIGKPEKEVVRMSENVAKVSVDAQAPSCRKAMSDIRKHYPNGFDFSDNAVRLVEARCGLFTRKNQSVMQQLMYRQKSGLWFFHEQIFAPLQQAKFLLQADELLNEHSCFSLSRLMAEYGCQMSHLANDAERNRFAEMLLTRHRTDISFEGEIQDRLCYVDSEDVSVILNGIAQKLHQILHDACGPVRLVILTEAFPQLSETIILNVCDNILSDVVAEDDGNGEKSLQLLEFYYLPDDFVESLKSAIDAIEAQGIAPTIVKMSEYFDECYGGNFAENYALSNEDVFKRVIALAHRAATDRPLRRWKGNTFVVDVAPGKSEEGNQRKGIVASFLEYLGKTSEDLFFNENEFFEFARDVWGLKGFEGVWVEYLRDAVGDESVLRLNQTTWITRDKFISESNWSDQIASEIAGKLNEQLGTNAYFPFAHLSSAFYDSLPSVLLAGEPVKWNAYFIIALAKHLLPNIRVENDTRGSYEHTAFLCPLDAQCGRKTELHYVLNVLKNSSTVYKSVDEVFEQVKKDFVRVNLTKKIRNIIHEIMGVD